MSYDPNYIRVFRTVRICEECRKETDGGVEYIHQREDGQWWSVAYHMDCWKVVKERNGVQTLAIVRKLRGSE
jgi:hypothetical protein